MSPIRWVRTPDELANAIENYGDRVHRAVVAVAQEIAAEMSAYAKRHHPWTNRTGDAERGLFSEVEENFARRLVTIYLSGGPDVDYQIWLEVRWHGRYAIIMRTIQAHLPELERRLNAVLRG